MIKRLSILATLIASLVVIAYFNPIEQEEPQPSRWQKITMRGQPIDIWSGPWSCVLDKKTGLLWEVKTDSENIHDSYWSYSWFDGSRGVPDRGDCFFDDGRCDSFDHVTRTNAESLCGRSDWRVPTTDELYTLINLSVPNGQAKISGGFFPRVRKGDYWTTDHSIPLSGFYSRLGEGANAVDFRDGQVKTLPYRNAAFLILVTQAR
ncbi:Lcl C-terminal domain-containing protein [Vibrio coralliilyticus]|uniref:Lcl C-terminal domain-containing protein n=1 Tax=Vibrio coralliilyticus TaxID=190893 RepID=UPI001E53BE9C|nr:DUF1566 domain-containing protein [Vibrio coralliilyticus]MCC2523828.1 DUF1566 domain-containing protein [Vibrio coralliilyticus]